MSRSGPVVLGVPASLDFATALAFAAERVARTGSELCLVHAFEMWPVAPELELHLRHVQHRAGEVLRRAEEQARDLLGPDVVVTTKAIRGPVVASITSASEGADLVVLQRRDRALATRLLTRSTSCGIAARSHACVAVVPERVRDTRNGVVTVGIDVPKRSAVVLRRALEEAEQRRSALRVVHAIWHLGGLGEYLVEQSTADRHVDEVRADVEAAVARSQRSHGGVDVEVVVRRADPADTLMVESLRSDLLLVDRHDPVVPVGSHLGPVASALVRESGCPVLVVAPTHRHR